MTHKLLIAAIVFGMVSCTSNGVKSGILQKVSHKKFPCSRYEAEVAYYGGRSSDGGFSNSQVFTISRAAFDTLQDKVGKSVRFEYHDRAMTLCEQSKVIDKLSVIN